MILQSPEIWHRDDFAYLCFHRLLYNAIEIGVEKGTFSDIMMTRGYHFRNYVGVDPYIPYEELSHGRDADLIIAAHKYAKHGQRATLVRSTSEEFVEEISSGNFGHIKEKEVDFVYIDGDHSYEAVKNDLKIWWKVLSPKGILAGHDYDPSHPGVMRAVEEFVAEHKVNCYLTMETLASFYIYKNEPKNIWNRVRAAKKEGVI